jgi:hypothetical protein
VVGVLLFGKSSRCVSFLSYGDIGLWSRQRYRHKFAHDLFTYCRSSSLLAMENDELPKEQSNIQMQSHIQMLSKEFLAVLYYLDSESGNHI